MLTICFFSNRQRDKHKILPLFRIQNNGRILDYFVITVFILEGTDFFWELATLIVIMLLGHWIEMKSVMGASNVRIPGSTWQATHANWLCDDAFQV